jgi:hypothetical protein
MLQGRLARNARSVGGHGARQIDDIYNARTSGKITALELICQGAILVESNLMIVCVALA